MIGRICISSCEGVYVWGGRYLDLQQRLRFHRLLSARDYPKQSAPIIGRSVLVVAQGYRINRSLLELIGKAWGGSSEKIGVGCGAGLSEPIGVYQN